MSCYDCARPYGDEHGFPDLAVPDDVWRRISPTGDDGGLLCPSCICKRLHEAGIVTTGRFMSGPLDQSATGRPGDGTTRPRESTTREDVFPTGSKPASAQGVVGAQGFVQEGR